eukprot:g5791.t1
MPSNSVGVTLALVGALASNFGTNLQKRTHMIDEKLPKAARRAYYRRPLWWLGFGLVTLGAVADFVALGQGAVSLVTAVGGAAVLLANVGFAHLWNHEDIYGADVAGVGFVVSGAVLIAVSSPPAQGYSLAQLETMFGGHRFLIYIGAEFSVALLLILLIRFPPLIRWRVRRLDDLHHATSWLDRQRALSPFRHRVSVGNADELGAWLDAAVAEHESLLDADAKKQQSHEDGRGADAAAPGACGECCRGCSEGCARLQRKLWVLLAFRIEPKARRRGRTVQAGAEGVDGNGGAEDGRVGAPPSLASSANEDEDADSSSVFMSPPPQPAPTPKLVTPALSPGAVDEDEDTAELQHWSSQYVYAACAGAVGAFSVLLASCASHLLAMSVGGNSSEVGNARFWLFIFGMFGTVALQTDLLNRGMMLGDTMSVFPVFQAFWIELSSIGGTVFYKTEVQRGVTIGSVLLLVGICFLVQHGRIAYLQAMKQRRASMEPAGHSGSAARRVAEEYKREEQQARGAYTPPGGDDGDPV